MSGSSLVPIITPIVTLPLMAFWLIMVFHADSHPGYRHRPPLPEPDAVAGALRPQVTPMQPGELAPTGAPAVSEQPDEGQRKVPAGL